MTPSPRESAIVGWTASLEDKSHVMRYPWRANIDISLRLTNDLEL